jgi:hypothetical protein
MVSSFWVIFRAFGACIVGGLFTQACGRKKHALCLGLFLTAFGLLKM